ncbi:MAG: ATP-dependent protease [Betaproteobacteria bacterium]|nr:MAG: ATP-dependent protease [Betaproteobacteria bacterium]
MSLAITYSRALSGLHAELVTVEVHLANGLPAFNLVGLPDTEVRESRDRVRAAIQTAGFEFPARKLTVNLAPADVPKESGRFDLPIAIGILAASGQLPRARLAELEFGGELGLNGDLRSVRGALAMALAATKSGRSLVLPRMSATEAIMAPNASVYAADTLLQVAAHVAGRAPLSSPDVAEVVAPIAYPDLSDVRGQTQAKRALEIAAAGRHSLLMIGPPGTGKSMLAHRLPGILPPLTERESVDSAAVLSLVGRFKAEQFGQRPIRSPHHTASAVAMVGGGSDPRPGEISLAHHGILFLDELPEFDRKVLEVLREPLETRHINISRAARQVTFPSHFTLIAAMNPCPDGYAGANIPARPCRCTPDQISRYRGRISGPLLDRIDLQVQVAAQSAQTLRTPVASESSAVVRARVIEASERQLARQGMPNADLTSSALDEHCALDTPTENLLRQASDRMGLSGRGQHRVLRVARTIADIAGAARISTAHLAEALGYRRVEA